MKVLIVSDSHRRDENLKLIIAQTRPIDMLIHLGDSEGSEVLIPAWVNENCRLEMVLGNNDFFSSLDREKEVRIGRYRVLLTHGHYYSVSLGTERLFEEANDRGCHIAMYGHTHKPLIEVRDGITVLNPGSISYPRQEGRKPSYIIMELDECGEAQYEICYIES